MLRMIGTLLLCLLPLTGYAAEGKALFNTLYKAAQANDLATVQAHSTQSSQDYLTRLYSYEFYKVMPANVSYTSERQKDGALIVKATRKAAQEQYTELLFTKENGEWKFDLPATASHGLGANWQERVDAIENTYKLLQAQFPGTFTPDMLSQMLEKATDTPQ